MRWVPSGKPTGAPVGVPSVSGIAAEANAREAFHRLQDEAEPPAKPHRCGNCYVPGFGRSAIRCPNDDTLPPAPEIDFEAEHDPACRGCIEQSFVRTRRAEFDEKVAA